MKAIVTVVNRYSDLSIPCQIHAERKNPQKYLMCFNGNQTVDSESNVRRINFTSLKEILSEGGIVHSHHNASALLVMVMSLFLKLKGLDIVSLHSIHCQWNNYTIKNKIAASICAILADKVTFNSKETLKSFPPFYQKIVSDRKCIIYNPVMVPEDLEYDSKQKIITHVARLEPVKNQRFIIDVFNIFQRTVPGWRLELVGDGSLRRELEQYVQEKGIDNVSFVGLKTRKEVFSILSKSQIHMMASFSEGFGNSNIEALCFGNKLVLNDLPVFKEVLDNNSTLFYKTGDISDAVNSLVSATKNINSVLYDSECYQTKFSLEQYESNLKRFICQ